MASTLLQPVPSEPVIKQSRFLGRGAVRVIDEDGAPVLRARLNEAGQGLLVWL